MANETVLHRVDAELAADQPIAAIPDDLAADGIVKVATAQRSWLVRMAGGTLRVDDPAAASASAAIEGCAPDGLLWLWNRGGQDVTLSGDRAPIALLRNVVDAVLGHRVED